MSASEPAAPDAPPSRRRRLSARIEPFDSYWQAPKDVEKGFSSFGAYYRANFLPRLPADRSARILVVSCGPGYLVKTLADEGWRNVVGIDSDPEKIGPGVAKGLALEAAAAFEYLGANPGAFDAIVGEQELNHLTKGEMIEFLELCREALRPGGTLLVYGLNGANPITGADALAHNLDHFHTFTDYSLGQALELAGFRDAKPFGLELYVFWKNPLNYVGLFVTSLLHFGFRVLFKLYGKEAHVFTKKIGASAVKPAGPGGAPPPV